MSKQRAKGTRGENEIRDFLRPVFPGVERTGSDHSTPWGAADLRETGQYAIEVKAWKDQMAAIREGWPQALRNAAYSGHIPVLVAKTPRKSTAEAVVLMRLGGWRDLIRRAEGRAQ